MLGTVAGTIRHDRGGIINKLDFRTDKERIVYEVGGKR